MGYITWLPQLPNKDKPIVKCQARYIYHQGLIFNDTVIIAHSAGVPLALSVIESLINQELNRRFLWQGLLNH